MREKNGGRPVNRGPIEKRKGGGGATAFFYCPLEQKGKKEKAIRQLAKKKDTASWPATEKTRIPEREEGGTKRPLA